MRRLMGGVRRLILRAQDQSGATLIFVTIALLGLLAMTAYAIDFGRIWQERRELQNGATAAALAIAEDCARGLCDLSYDEFLVGEFYADANATDGAAWVPQIDLDLAGQTVHVVTATEDEDGDNLFDMLFARIVGFDGLTVGAEATVAWGAPLMVPTIPLIISECEWMRPEVGEEGLYPNWPAGGTNLFPENPLPPPDGNGGYVDPVYVSFHAGGEADQCNAQAGQDVDQDGFLPGGFGWLDTTGDCAAQVWNANYSLNPIDYGWVGSDPGSSPSNGCSASELKTLLLGEDGNGAIVMIPYFFDVDGVDGQGQAGDFHISGYGAFYTVGYNFGGQYKEYTTPLNGLPTCPGPGSSGRCLVGYFTNGTVTTGDLGGEDRGVILIKLIG